MDPFEDRIHAIDVRTDVCCFASPSSSARVTLKLLPGPPDRGLIRSESAERFICRSIQVLHRVYTGPYVLLEYGVFVVRLRQLLRVLSASSDVPKKKKSLSGDGSTFCLKKWRGQ